MCKQIRVLIKNCLLALSLILGLSVISPPVHAATFDFVDLIDDVGEQEWSTVLDGNVGGGVFVNASDTWTVGGISVVASATGGVAYLDDRLSNGSPGGLGVCTTISGGDCDPGSDDNISLGETLKLTFDVGVSLVDLLIGNDSHGLFTGSIVINGEMYDVLAGVLAALDGSFSTMWVFEIDGAAACPVGSPRCRQFYVRSLVAAVPIPAAGILFGSALAGIGFLSRRRRKKQNRQAVTGLVSQG